MPSCWPLGSSSSAFSVRGRGPGGQGSNLLGPPGTTTQVSRACRTLLQNRVGLLSSLLLLGAQNSPRLITPACWRWWNLPPAQHLCSLIPASASIPCKIATSFCLFFVFNEGGKFYWSVLCLLLLNCILGLSLNVLLGKNVSKYGNTHLCIKIVGRHGPPHSSGEGEDLE